MRAALKLQVRRRARFRCEYCSGHVENLAFACLRCNSRKGPNLSGLDPQTGEMVRLFNPRKDIWTEHSPWHRAVLVGLTPVEESQCRCFKSIILTLCSRE
jgi:hypothetical protein